MHYGLNTPCRAKGNRRRDFDPNVAELLNGNVSMTATNNLILFNIVLLLTSGTMVFTPPQKKEVVTTAQGYPRQWKVYRNEKAGFEISYPKNFLLVELSDRVILSHSVPYKNSGPCDLMGDSKSHTRLTDFSISIQLTTNKVKHEFVDGQYKAGLLEGSWVYEGTEGCGYTSYHFPLRTQTLVVKRDAVQALSGTSSLWNREEILKIPGVISSEEAEKIFHQILLSFRLIVN